MQTYARMASQEVLHEFRLVSREVVGDNVDLFGMRLAGSEPSKKLNEFGRGVTRDGLAKNTPCLRVESGIQAEHAVPVILEPMSFRTTRRERQDRVESIERLNRSPSPQSDDNGVFYSLPPPQTSILKVRPIHLRTKAQRIWKRNLALSNSTRVKLLQGQNFARALQRF